MSARCIQRAVKYVSSSFPSSVFEIDGNTAFEMQSALIIWKRPDISRNLESNVDKKAIIFKLLFNREILRNVFSVFSRR